MLSLNSILTFFVPFFFESCFSKSPQGHFTGWVIQIIKITERLWWFDQNIKSVCMQDTNSHAYILLPLTQKNTQVQVHTYPYCTLTVYTQVPGTFCSPPSFKQSVSYGNAENSSDIIAFIYYDQQERVQPNPERVHILCEWTCTEKCIINLQLLLFCSTPGQWLASWGVNMFFCVSDWKPVPG